MAKPIMSTLQVAINIVSRLRATRVSSSLMRPRRFRIPNARVKIPLFTAKRKD